MGLILRNLNGQIKRYMKRFVQDAAFNLLFLVFLGFIIFSSFQAHAAVYYVDQNHPNVSDANPGTEDLPWKTIQKAAYTLVAGDIVYVKEGVYIKDGMCEYDGYYGSGNVCYIKPKNSGAPDKPITYAAYPRHKVVIDNQNDPAYVHAFRITSKGYITIKGFEIRNIKGGGIQTHPDANHIIIENNHIHHLDGPAGTNVGAVKLNGCSFCIVRDNRLHDVYVAGDMLNQNSAGVHSYDMSNTTIINNEIWNTAEGIFHKRSAGIKGAIIKNNIIHDIKIRGIWYSIAGAGGTPHIDQEVYNNIFYNMPIGISAGSLETSGPSDGLKIANNTFYNVQTGISIANYKNVAIWNNIFSELGTEYYHNAIATEKTTPTDFIVLSDYNLFYPGATFLLHTYTTEAKYSSLSDWQNATGFDTHGLNNDPVFADAHNHNYNLKENSPAKYAGSSDGTLAGSKINMGAYQTGSEIIGPIKPNPPINPR